jgi:hypothetical protein
VDKNCLQKLLCLLKLKSVKKPKKSVSIEVLSLGKPKGDDFEEDEDEEEV